jgi:SAM-dependent methyltransferase
MTAPSPSPTPATALPSLSEAQTHAFDVEYVDDSLWDIVAPHVQSALSPHGRVLDVGGGNGSFLDRLLDVHPTAEGVLIEPSTRLLSSNRSRARKRVLAGTLQEHDLDRLGPFDLIHFNWVLHHIVSSDYRRTLEAQREALALAARALAPGGRIVVLENVWTGVLRDEVPSRILYALTSSRVLSPLVRRLGSNTAGVGVAYHSRAGWRSRFVAAGLEMKTALSCYEYGELSLPRRAILQAETPSVELYVLARQGR